MAGDGTVEGRAAERAQQQQVLADLGVARRPVIPGPRGKGKDGEGDAERARRARAVEDASAFKDGSRDVKARTEALRRGTPDTRTADASRDAARDQDSADASSDGARRGDRRGDRGTDRRGDAPRPETPRTPARHASTPHPAGTPARPGTPGTTPQVPPQLMADQPQAALAHLMKGQVPPGARQPQPGTPQQPGAQPQPGASPHPGAHTPQARTPQGNPMPQSFASAQDARAWLSNNGGLPPGFSSVTHFVQQMVQGGRMVYVFSGEGDAGQAEGQEQFHRATASASLLLKGGQPTPAVPQGMLNQDGPGETREERFHRMFSKAGSTKGKGGGTKARGGREPLDDDLIFGSVRDQSGIPA
jgi:hypothetical protein